jgi:hypothetical protein
VKPARRNVTFSLPEPLLRKFRVYAAKRNRSMTSLAADAIERILEQDEDSEEIKRRMIERLMNPPGWSSGGKITWTRDEIHER